MKLPTSNSDHLEQARSARDRAMQLLKNGASLRDVLSALTLAVESLAHGYTAASILVIDREGLLRNGASPNLPADYLDKIDRIRPDPNVGTCAAAAARGEIIFTPDFRKDGKWAELKHLPLEIGFRGAWSMPIKTQSGRVVGTFGTYFREPRLPTAEEMETVSFLVPASAAAIVART